MVMILLLCLVNFFLFSIIDMDSHYDFLIISGYTYVVVICDGPIHFKYFL